MNAPVQWTELPYSRLDRLLHRVAFASIGAQKALADVETRIFRDRIEPGHAKRPVFVTSLPRAGTTVLLEVLAAQPELAAATYRQMPFTLVPLLWSDATRRFQRASRQAERAHGDGVEVGFDSPEAFEEVLWLAFWPEHYGEQAIRPWERDASHPEFEAFFREHMAKIVAADGNGARRYLSKNNANIARIPLLERLFPDATVVVPVRNPWAQAASLHRQHLRFSELHVREPFARRYMEGIGHFEFGAALKPIAFGEDAPDISEAGRPEFWLRYWADAYDAVLTTAGDRVVFVDHDALSREPERYLPALGAALELADPHALGHSASRFRPPRPVEAPDAPPELLARVSATYDALRQLCLNPSPEPSTDT
jgi:Sulfotransferase family